jgi:diguanylate cyclase (GGDEF)-like protein
MRLSDRILARIRGATWSFSEPRTMAVALGALYLAGAAIGSLSLLLPHPAEYDEGALWSNIAIAFVGGVGMLVLRNRMPKWAIQLGLFAGTVIVARAVYYGDDPSGYYTFWYLWVGVYSFFFFGRTWGLLQIAAIGGTYAWVLAELDAVAPVSRWVVTVGSILVAGLLIDILAGRLQRETRAAATRAANLEAVGEVARHLATQSDPRAVGWAICSAALRATDASAAILWRPTPAGSELVATAAAGVNAEGTRLPFVTPSSGAIQAFTSAERRFDTLEQASAAQELAPKLAAGAALWEPVLKDKGAAVGVLAVYWDEAWREVGAETKRAVRLLALEAAIAIDRGELLGRLEQAARTDDLTGLLNRRAWDSELGRELGRAAREHQPLCVAVIDLDRFKQYNDAHGHQAGDRFLKQVSGTWSGALRTTDILARHGGEEFALAMPGIDIEAARTMLERLRRMLPKGQTCSAGVCVWDGSESAEKLLARADAALYDAKAGGRDRVVVV